MSFEVCTFIVVNHLQWAYVQILLRDALRHPCPLNENVPVFDTLSCIYTGSFYLFDLASFGTNVKLKNLTGFAPFLARDTNSPISTY